MVSYLYYTIFLLGSFSYIKNFKINKKYFTRLDSAGGFVHGISNDKGIYLEENQEAFFKFVKENINDPVKEKSIGEYIGKLFRHIEESKYLKKSAGEQLKNSLFVFLTKNPAVYDSVYKHLSNGLNQELAAIRKQKRKKNFL